MKEYLVTALAGKEVGGMANPGVGEDITLSDAQAEQPLRLGHIKRKPEKASSSATTGDARRTGKRK